MVKHSKLWVVSQLVFPFENGKATLDTRCYDAVGVYSVSESNGKNKINFALKDYINVLPKEESIQSPIEKSMVISALHSLTWNDSFESKVNNDFGVTSECFWRNRCNY